MPLPPGVHLGAYEVLSPLGAGGMGEVYRARDTRLGRDVAIKILPETVAGDTEREARFAREAQILATLNHPHIAAIYGLEQAAPAGAGDVRFLVLELVDGQTLAERLKALGSRGLDVDESIAIARQIAEALHAAHEKGVIHRDLKPANIALTADGQVKVLDFGLAKFAGADETRESGAAGPGVSQSPTLTFAATEAGMILGTAAYMSPEQAKGRAADKRSDIWGFGCVLFEMLTGRKPFEGDDISDTLAAILRGEPDWMLLPPGLSPTIRALVERCLKKDRSQRIADIAVVQFLLNEPAAPAEVAARAPAARGRSRLWQAVVAVLALTTIGAAAAVYWYRDRPALETTQFLVTPPENGAFVTGLRTGTSAAISPDGRRLAFTARDEAGKVLIWLRALDALAAQPLAGTDNAEFPFWSPDSRSLAYFANGKLLRIDASGGPPQALCAAEGARGGAWGPNGVIVFGGGVGTSHTGLNRVAAGGGEATIVTKTADGDHRFPSFLPDGRHVLFHFNAPGAREHGGLHVVALDSGAPKRLAAADSSAVYGSPGFLLFARQATLLAQPFDLDTLSLAGEPTPVAERVESGVYGGVPAFSVSETGVLAYGVGTGREAELQLTWLDRQGKMLSTIGPPGNYVGLALSPDEKQVVVHRHEDGIGGDLWLMDLTRGIQSRFTFEPGQDNFSAVWSPDGGRIAFASLRKGSFGMYVKAANSSTAEEAIDHSSASTGPQSWSPDGRFLLYVSNEAGTRADAFMLPLAGDRKPIPLLRTPFVERSPQVSPDGKWLAYASDETGTPEVYVRPFPAGDGKWQVSSAGGVEPQWRGDTRELFYIDRPQLGSVMAVDVTTTNGVLQPGTPRKLIDEAVLSAGHPGVAPARYAVSRDGQRILIARNPRAATFADATSAPIAVVLNWAARLRR